MASTSVVVSWSPADNPTVTGYQLIVVILGATDNTTHSVVTVDGASTATATLTSLGMYVTENYSVLILCLFTRTHIILTKCL